MERVIDLSSYQGKSKLTGAKAAGISGVILRSIKRDKTLDTSFSHYLAEAATYGMKLEGIYMYLYTTPQNYVEYCNALCVVYGDYDLTCPVILDIENAEVFLNGSLDLVANYLRNELGCKIIYYTYLSMYQKYAEYIPEGSEVWIARYPSSTECTPNSMPDLAYLPQMQNGHILKGWQFSSRCRIEGFSGYVDISLWNSSEESETEGNPYQMPSAHFWYVPENNQRGDGVGWIQYHLKRLGFYTGELDCIFGSKTHEAVVAAQKHFGFYSHGVVESETRYILQMN